MGSRDYRDRIEPTLRPGLAPDERLLAASPLMSDPGATEDVSVAEELSNLVNPALYLGAAGWSGSLVPHVVFGRALAGSPDSLAGQLFGAVEGVSGGAMPAIAVTDVGIVIFTIDNEPRGRGWFQRWFGAVDRVATVVHRVPRGDLAGAAVAPRGVLRRGRFQVAFTDGSVCALCAHPPLAKPVVGAIGAPKPH